MAQQLVDDKHALVAIDRQGRFEDARPVPVTLRGGHQSVHVLPETGATPAHPRVQELPTDARVQPHGGRDFRNIGADAFTDAGDLIDEADLGGQEGVGGVLDRLRGRDIGENKRLSLGPVLSLGKIAFQDRAIGIGDGGQGDLVVPAEHDAVGMKEVLDGVAFPQELRVGHDAEQLPGRARGQRVLEDGGQPPAGADGDGALGDQDVREAQVPRYRPGHRLRGRHVRVTLAAQGGPDADEDDVATVHGPDHVAGEGQAPRAQARAEEVIETGLVEGRPPPAEADELVRVDLEAGHLMPDVGKARRRYGPHVPAPYYRDP